MGILMGQYVSEGYDALVLAYASGLDFVDSGKLAQCLPDEFKLALHGGAQHCVAFIVREGLAGGELSQQADRLLNVRRGISSTQASYTGVLVSSTD